MANHSDEDIFMSAGKAQIIAHQVLQRKNEAPPPPLPPRDRNPARNNLVKPSLPLRGQSRPGQDKPPQYVNMEGRLKVPRKVPARAQPPTPPAEAEQGYIPSFKSPSEDILKKVRVLSERRRFVDQEKDEEVADEDDEDEIYLEALSICLTLDRSLRKDPPKPDTLCLNHPKRVALCQNLYITGAQVQDWKYLASTIGLDFQATSLIEAFTSYHNHETAAELVLRHWQHRFNKYGVNEEKCPFPCTKAGLAEVLKIMNREDLLDIFKTR